MNAESRVESPSTTKCCKWCRRPVTPAGALESEHPELCGWDCGEEYRAKFPTREARS